MTGYSKPELYDLGKEMIVKAYDGTLDFQEAFSKYDKKRQELQAAGEDFDGQNPWESFRSVFGWGYDTESRILGPNAFQVIEQALMRTKIIDATTYHNYNAECVDGDGNVLFEANNVKTNDRRQSYIYTITPAAKIPNGLVVPIQ